MIVKNPTDKEIRVQIKGNKYVLPAAVENTPGVLKNIPENIAYHWKTHLHNFLIVEPEVAEAPKIEAPKTAPEVKEEVKEEVAPVVGEKPVAAKNTAKKTVKK